MYFFYKKNMYSVDIYPNTMYIKIQNQFYTLASLVAQGFACYTAIFSTKNSRLFT